jgi:hypothetical protein
MTPTSMQVAMLARRFLTAIGLIVCSIAVVADEELPEIEFLEYLGLWEESDEEWVMFNDPLIAENKDQQRNEPAPEGKESTETHDEN